MKEGDGEVLPGLRNGSHKGPIRTVPGNSDVIWQRAGPDVREEAGHGRGYAVDLCFSEIKIAGMLSLMRQQGTERFKQHVSNSISQYFMKSPGLRAFSSILQINTIPKFK